MNNHPTPWTYQYHNDVDAEDDCFWYWYEVYDAKGGTVAKCDTEEAAQLLVRIAEAYDVLMR